MQSGLRAAGINQTAVQMIPTTDRAAVGYLLSSMSEFIDVVVPRGGKSLIQRVQQEARVPVIGHLEGLCHVYLHESADTQMATAVSLNAKMRRTGICGAAETLLVDRNAAEKLLPSVCDALIDAGCEIRGDETVLSLITGANAATEDDWSEEYLEAIISVRVVDDIDAALATVPECSVTKQVMFSRERAYHRIEKSFRNFLAITGHRIGIHMRADISHQHQAAARQVESGTVRRDEFGVRVQATIDSLLAASHPGREVAFHQA
jgi:hypothetical protein